MQNQVKNAIVGLALALQSLSLFALPQAPVVTYGLVRDDYGRPFGTSVDSPVLELVRNADRSGRVYARCTVGESGFVGMNYRLSLEIDSEGPNRDCAVLEGTEMFVKATVGATEKALSPISVFTTPKQGTEQRLDYTLGEDADGDGLPDTWEAWVLEGAGREPTPAAIAAFRPGDDADGDGMTNLQEFLANTDPFIATDLILITAFELEKGTNRAKVSFTTTRERKFHLIMTETLGAPLWAPVAASATVDGALTYDALDGNGRTRSLYVDARLSAMFLRVVVD